MVRLGYLAVVAGAAVLGISATAGVPHWPVSITFVGAPAEPAPAAAEGPVLLQAIEYVAPEPAVELSAAATLIEPPVIRYPGAPKPMLAPPAATTPITPVSSESTPANEPPPAADPVVEVTAPEAPAPIVPVQETAAEPEAPAPVIPEQNTAAEAPASAAVETIAEPAAQHTPPAPIATERDIAIRIQLRFMDSDRASHGPIGKADRAAVAQFYKLRDYKPAWIADGRLTDAAQHLASRLMTAEVDGLDRRDFPTPPLYLGMVAPASAGALADADIMLSESIATYVHQAQAGRVDPQSIGRDIGFAPQAPDATAALNYLLTARDPLAAMVAYNPPHEGYARLREALAKARAAALVKEHSEIQPGPTLKPGMSEARVAQLRKRLELSTAAGGDPNLFDEELVEAVMAFQKETGLKPDGLVGGNTLKKLNDAVADPTAVIISNMERWRWMPRDLGRFYVNVNVPQFEVILHRNGAIIHSTRIVVGKPANKTPIFSDEIEHVIVNPYWNVPASITAKEMIPEILGDPGMLYRQNFEVFANVGGRFREVDPMLVDWYTVNPRQIQIRQRPGGGNALGNIKFMFPNKYDVYLHDTPTKSLFQRDYRAFSHGCMRVMNPMDFADALLTEEPDLSVARIKKLIGGREQRLDMARHVPVHITYFTAWADDDGKLQLRDDLYGYDARVLKALGL